MRIFHIKVYFLLIKIFLNERNLSIKQRLTIHRISLKIFKEDSISKLDRQSLFDMLPCLVFLQLHFWVFSAFSGSISFFLSVKKGNLTSLIIFVPICFLNSYSFLQCFCHPPFSGYKMSLFGIYGLCIWNYNHHYWF